MTVVVWRDVCVRVKVQASSISKIDAAFEEIQRDVKRIASKRVLISRHSLDKVEAYGPYVRSEPVT